MKLQLQLQRVRDAQALVARSYEGKILLEGVEEVMSAQFELVIGIAPAFGPPWVYI